MSIVFPDDLREQYGVVFTDNSTLLEACSLLEPYEEWEKTKNRILGYQQESSGSIAHAISSAALNLIQSLVIYDSVVVDGFVLANYPQVISLAKQFSPVIRGLYAEELQRQRIAIQVGQQISALATLVSNEQELNSLLTLCDWEEQDLFHLLHFTTGLLDRSDQHLPRTFFYALLSKAFKIPYSPHPYRCPFFEKCAGQQINAA